MKIILESTDLKNHTICAAQWVLSGIRQYKNHWEQKYLSRRQAGRAFTWLANLLRTWLAKETASTYKKTSGKLTMFYSNRSVWTNVFLMPKHKTKTAKLEDGYNYITIMHKRSECYLNIRLSTRAERCINQTPELLFKDRVKCIPKAWWPQVSPRLISALV